MEFIDTHTHIFLPEFSEDYKSVIDRAVENGISRMILPNVDRSTIPVLEKLTAQFPKNCFPALGLHPGSVNDTFDETLQSIKGKLYSSKCIAVGEIGIDLYWDQAFKEEQITAFDIQVKWAKELNLPIIIHNRDAFEEVYKVVKDNHDHSLKGVFHSFTGTIEQARLIMELGFYIGINGIVTFKNSELDAVVKQIPMNRLLLETDAPYLSPVPFRGKRNEPAHLIFTARKIAAIKGVSLEVISNETLKNSTDLFLF